MTHWTTEWLYQAFRRLDLKYTTWDYENFLIDGGFRSSCVLMQSEDFRELTAVLLSPELVRQQLDVSEIHTMRIDYSGEDQLDELVDLLKRAGFRHDYLPPQKPARPH